jgi:D-tyrosyl-tRNA(Tyr) deacylase
MRAVVQRVSRASVTVEGETVGSIELGLCVLVGVGANDGQHDVQALADKVVSLRVFEDSAGRMNHNVLEAGGKILAISQFTLFGDVRRGKRPSFTDAMEPNAARLLFDEFCGACRRLGAVLETGRFRAHMLVESVNVGPVTILIDSKKSF